MVLEGQSILTGHDWRFSHDNQFTEPEIFHSKHDGSDEALPYLRGDLMIPFLDFWRFSPGWESSVSAIYDSGANQGLGTLEVLDSPVPG